MVHRLVLRDCRIASLLAIALFALASTLAFSQTPAEPASPAPATLSSTPARPIEFDVAVFRLNKSGGLMPYIQIPLGGDGFIAQNRPIHDIIRYAFAKGRGGTFRISGEPAWIDDDRYDIQAKVAIEDLPEWKKLNGFGQKIVLQAFLIEYLKLKFHPDPTPYPYYALVVGKSGPKMTPFKPGDSVKTPDGQTLTGRSLTWTTANEVTGLSCEMERLADQLSGRADRPVLDKTGLTGDYNFVLKFDPESDPSLPEGVVRPFLALPPDTATLSIFSSVKQLGLQLLPAKGPLDAIVIDPVERPPDN